VVVSRQAWQAYRNTHPLPIKKDLKSSANNNNKSSNSNSSSTDDMPWPKSVVYGAYVAAATLIPYFSAWFVASNPVVRERMELVVPNVQDRLRGHFGKPDVDAVSYSDTVAVQGEDVHSKQSIPYILPHEWPLSVRREQQAIQKLVSAPVHVQIQLVDDDLGTSTGITGHVRVQKVPGSTRARPDTLLALITSSSSTQSPSSTQSSTFNLPAIAVDFLPDDDDNMNTFSNDDDMKNGNTSFTTSESSSSSLQSMDSMEWTDSAAPGSTSSRGNKTTVDPLQQTAHIFSSWHYQPPANVPNSGSSSGNSNKGNAKTSNKSNNRSSSSSMDDIERSRLEYQIAELEWQLKDRNNPRSVDDTMDELNQAKAALSKLKWNRWTSWK
jgi:hypothetical protein